MSSTAYFKELEKNTWKSFFENGLLDITIGLCLIVGSICHIFDNISYYLMPLYLVPVLFAVLSQRYIVAPRMGIVKFSRKRKRKSTILFSVILPVLIFLVILTALSKINYISNGTVARLMISSIILLICFANAFFLNFSRLYIYGVVITGAFNLNEYIRENPGFISEGGYAYLLAAVVILIAGCIYLIKFLKKYALPVK